MLMILGFMAFAGFIMWMAARASALAQENVRRMAGSIGLELQAAAPLLGVFYPAPRATGRVRGKAVAVYNYHTGTGKSRRTWCALSVTPAATSGLNFALTRQGLGSKLKEMFGAKEITVGNHEFDRTWFIQTNEPDFFQAALLPELQEKIQAFKGSFKLAEEGVTYVEEGSFSTEERCTRFARAVEVVCDLADIAEVFARQTRRTS